MTKNNFHELFNSDEATTLTIKEVAEWRQREKGSRLLLPPIQRSIVWTNEQIANYWDSLLRGYPAGMMIVHRIEKETIGSNNSGRDADGNTHQANEDDFQLFDGQQRMTAVLLGLGTGQMRNSRRLWIDIGMEPNKNSGLKFQLRLTSTGQPFGYKLDAPNQKIELGKRQKKWEEWKKNTPEHQGRKSTPQHAFKHIKGKDIIDSKCTIAFDEVCDSLCKNGLAATITALSQEQDADPTITERFVGALERALSSRVILQKMDSKIVANEEEYIRFFGRLGQGGTRLSDDELTYSIIKQQYPEIHDRMNEIMDDQVGRLASEVDLVLAALRVAKTLKPWNNAKEWEIISRPTPSFVSQLKDKEREPIRSKFTEIVGLQQPTSILKTALTALRKSLSYDAVNHTKGLPAILLASLPRELIDVLLLFSLKHNSESQWTEINRKTIRAFVLYWLFFVYDDEKAAWFTFRHAKNDNWLFSEKFIHDLIAVFEENRISHHLPKPDAISTLRSDIGQKTENDYLLRTWADRFKSIDSENNKKPGEALRVLSTNTTHLKRALMWLQRDYISINFPDYDPTSGRDEDLPIDLDHIIPASIFGFDYRYRGDHLDLKTYPFLESDNFRWGRSIVGNSLGNYRWLDASENRHRGNGAFIPLRNQGDFIENPDDWNKIIPQDKNKRPWSKDDVAIFQRLIDLRTLDLYEILLVDSGIIKILPTL